MKALDRKLLRDLLGMKGQMAAIAVVMACGLSMMLMARGLLRSLEDARDLHYERQRFGDVFCELTRAPDAVRAKLAAVPGVTAVETRVAGAVTLVLPGMREPADGRIFSIPGDRPQRLDLLFLRQGRLPGPGRGDEVVASESFANAHGFRPGDTIDVVIRGSRERLRIVGIGLSPEFVIETRAGDTVPDERRHGIFWMDERALSKALDLDGAFNSVVASVDPGAGVGDIKSAFDRLLEPYGGRDAYGRDYHPSAKIVDDHIREMRNIAWFYPVVFLGIAAFMASATLTRLVHLQREQIAQLKALGYSGREVGWHYAKHAIVVASAGSVLGMLGGFLMGDWVTGMFQRFFHFQLLEFHPAWGSMLAGLAASVGAIFLGVQGAVRHAVGLHPAEAMRPEPPADFRPSLFERLGLGRHLPHAIRMALRNIERKPLQAFLTTVGLACATAISILPCVMGDGLAYLMDFQWGLAQRQDVTVALVEPDSAGVVGALRRMPGVRAMEVFRSVPVTISSGHHERRIALMGMEREARLGRVLDGGSRPVPLPISGVLLSAKLADVLDVAPGDTVRIRVKDGGRPVVDAVVAGTLTDFAGLGAYMEIGALWRLLEEDRTVSGANLSIDAAQEGAFFDAVKATPRIASMTITRITRANFQRTTAEMMGIMQTLYFGFASIVSFGVVYNGARVALSERTRDLATLRVLGFTVRETAGVLIGELVILTLVAVGPGLWLGRELARWIISNSDTETVRMPLVISGSSYATAVVIVLVASAFSFAVVLRRLRRLDLLGVLNAKD